jgi:hypothetical protein
MVIYYERYVVCQPGLKAADGGNQYTTSSLKKNTWIFWIRCRKTTSTWMITILTNSSLKWVVKRYGFIETN